MVDHKSKFLPIVLIICIVFLFIFYRSEKAVSTNVARSLKEMSDSYLTTNVTVIRLISEIKDLQQNIKMSEKSIEESKAKENDLKKKLGAFISERIISGSIFNFDAMENAFAKRHKSAKHHFSPVRRVQQESRGSVSDNGPSVNSQALIRNPPTTFSNDFVLSGEKFIGTGRDFSEGKNWSWEIWP